jgi:ABC-2 type transport system ATP-binding protein
MSIVETSNISKTYRSGLFKRSVVHALTGVSLSVRQGEIFGLLGPNGAGKTTFVKILLSIVHPTGGEATVAGEKLGDLSIRERSGYLPENHRYPAFLTGLQTLIFFGSLTGMKGKALTDRADRLLELVGLKDWKKVKIKRYSKGMLQRLGLAQALLNDPDLLFLDEPTDGVDPVGRKEIRDLLTSLRSQGKTIFLNSHLLSEVEMISDRVAILNKGKVLKIGTIAELTSKQIEYELLLDRSLGDSVIEKLRPHLRSLNVDGKKLVIASESKVGLNTTLDILRSEGILIESMTQKRTTLEDSFIDLIQREATA